MRRSAIALIACLLAPATAFAAVTVPVNQSRKVNFSGQAANVVVGNPAIADVSIVDSRTVLITGRKFGVTNVVVLDGLGRTLFDNEILISSGGGSQVSVYRGAAAENYACSPYCQSVSGGSDAGAAAAAAPAAAAN